MSRDEKDLVPIVLDFSKARNEEGKLDEGWWLMFGGLMRWLMPALYKGSVLPLKIKGSSSEIESFADALSRERKYLESWKENGLDNPVTYRNRGMLDTAISKFSRVTGLKWPFTR